MRIPTADEAGFEYAAIRRLSHAQHCFKKCVLMEISKAFTGPKLNISRVLALKIPLAETTNERALARQIETS